MAFKFICSILLISILCLSCKKETIIVKPDKITRLMITQSNFLVLASNDTSEIFLGYLTAFNMKDYADVDSAKFVLIGGCNNGDKTYEVSLFDLTHNKTINNSSVNIGVNECNVNAYSKNIKDNFPKETIDIGIITNTPSSGSSWGTYLYLYRN